MHTRLQLGRETGALWCHPGRTTNLGELGDWPLPHRLYLRA